MLIKRMICLECGSTATCDEPVILRNMEVSCHFCKAPDLKILEYVDYFTGEVVKSGLAVGLIKEGMLEENDGNARQEPTTQVQNLSN